MKQLCSMKQGIGLHGALLHAVTGCCKCFQHCEIARTTKIILKSCNFWGNLWETEDFGSEGTHFFQNMSLKFMYDYTFSSYGLKTIMATQPCSIVNIVQRRAVLQLSTRNVTLVAR